MPTRRQPTPSGECANAKWIRLEELTHRFEKQLRGRRGVWRLTIIWLNIMSEFRCTVLVTNSYVSVGLLSERYPFSSCANLQTAASTFVASRRKYTGRRICTRKEKKGTEGNRCRISVRIAGCCVCVVVLERGSAGNYFFFIPRLWLVRVTGGLMGAYEGM